VEVYAVGGEAPLRELLSWLHHGPSGARVGEVEAEWGGTTQALVSRFDITG
jgi:acylphosphatase